ncbi:Transcription factor GLABRA 3 [Acorus calamus]|uniref:Transcription factor GLABRA 3 n=1 Tax=Acorus calamus TaxID=4465 RepID=A0AAV9EKU4_ACOCL|nr:Transcription factor GLABRA 3 [Acorus calamus]
MCRAMAAGLQNDVGVPENQFRKQLAASVRCIQWSYGVFWSISDTQNGKLQWMDGYYNGDIKTRKTIQNVELNNDQMTLQRSEQLRDLFLSLQAGENNQQARRPSASLSPEDLTDSEWYYLVCMSFQFDPGQGLPGRALANNQHIWLSNAQYADSNVFARSLLARSASIQTVVCFPFMSGVLEIGTTELVSEDPDLLQQVTTSFWEAPESICAERSTSSPSKLEREEDETFQEHETVKTSPLDTLNPLDVECPGNTEAEFEKESHEKLHADFCKELTVDSPQDSSNDDCPVQQTEDSFMMDEPNVTSQLQSWQFVDELLNNGPNVTSPIHGWKLSEDLLNNSLRDLMNSCNCVSKSSADIQRIVSSSEVDRSGSLIVDNLQESNHTKLSALDLGTNDESHFRRTLTCILRNSDRIVGIPVVLNNPNSSFSRWKKGPMTPIKNNIPQKLLKKMLLEVAWMCDIGSPKSFEENNLKERVLKPGDDTSVSHVLSERRRREKLNEKFVVLKSLIPSISKVDKASILGDTIEYLKDLEKRVEELESCREWVEHEGRGRRKYPDVAERTSDNYGNNDNATEKRRSLNKRKAREIDEEETGNHWISSKDGSVDVNVTVIDKEISIELHCPWRDCLLIEILDTICNLHLDAQNVQSSTADGILSLTLKSKYMGKGLALPGMIKQAIQRLVSKC